MFRTNFEKTLETATSHLLLEPDWPSIMVICDEINQKDATPKAAFAAIKKKMTSPNPHSACYALLVLESVVKNCGAPMHDEVFTKENCEMFSNFLEQTPHENVRQKMLELVQTWAYAFRSSDKYQSIKDTMTILKAKGHTFPELKEADAMFTADTAPNWADGKVCHRCRVEFTFTNRKHHCRNCGQVFCGQCTAKQCPLPKYGIEKEVRVCDGCFTSLQRPATKTAVRTADSDLPAEYLNSSLAQQVQTPLRKTEQELKEEEELQLALALSQSEAEQKKPQQPPQSFTAATYRAQQRSPSPEAPPAPKEEEITNPDLAKYLNRNYWEQRKVNENQMMASPSAPSPMPSTPSVTPLQQIPMQQPKSLDEVEIEEFAKNMRTQVEIFVNRMKSNSSRGRSISNDSSVQTLFMNLTSLHSQQLSYIKEMDDKRMWYEQLQDKLAQIKDSRAALDVLRQEHEEKLRLQAEEHERQRQIQMAQKLDIMRKKKQEYLQYQRQMALQRIQEQEREMQLRQEQQKAQYLMGQTGGPFPYMNNPGSPLDPQAMARAAAAGAAARTLYYAYPPGPMVQAGPQFTMPQPVPTTTLPGMYSTGPVTAAQPQPLLHGGGQMLPPGMMMPPGHISDSNNMTQAQLPQNHHQQQQQHELQQQMQQQQLPQQQQQLPQQQQIEHMVAMQPPAVSMPQPQLQQPQQLQQQVQFATAPPPTEVAAQIQAVAAAPAPPANEPEPVIVSPPVVTEPATAELISFD